MTPASQLQEYQCSWCARNKFNGDESCPLNLEGSNGNSDIFDGVNRVIKSCGCGSFIDTRPHTPAAPAKEPLPIDGLQEFPFRLSDPKCCKDCWESEPLCHDTCGKYEMDRDAAICKAERERLLGLIATYCACNGIEERIIGGDRFYEVEGTFSLPDFLNYIASLRGGEQK